MPFRSRLVVFAALAAMLAINLPAGAQRRAAGTLRVLVEDEQGRPVAGARVTLQASHGAQPRAVETGPDGAYQFRLARGHYDLRAYSDGAWSAWSRNVPVRTGQRTDVRLRLAATEEPQQP